MFSVRRDFQEIVYTLGLKTAKKSERQSKVFRFISTPWKIVDFSSNSSIRLAVLVRIGSYIFCPFLYSHGIFMRSAHTHSSSLFFSIFTISSFFNCYLLFFPSACDSYQFHLSASFCIMYARSPLLFYLCHEHVTTLNYDLQHGCTQQLAPYFEVRADELSIQKVSISNCGVIHNWRNFEFLREFDL